MSATNLATKCRERQLKMMLEVASRQSVARRVRVHEGRGNHANDHVKVASFGVWYSESDLSRQEPCHFGETKRHHSRENGYRAKSPAVMSGFHHSAVSDKAVRTEIRTLCPNRGKADQT